MTVRRCVRLGAIHAHHSPPTNLPRRSDMPSGCRSKLRAADATELRCGNCARHCPAGAISDGRSPNPKKRLLPKFRRSTPRHVAIGCGACENLCPARPFSAIYVEGHLKASYHRTHLSKITSTYGRTREETRDRPPRIS